jgi:magnesium-transporting ATPase (P-type)
MTIKHRSPVAIIILSIITFGIYPIYWLASTKGEINSLGAKIPTAWLIIVPIANIYLFYRYSEGFSIWVKKDNSPILWFLLFIVISPVAMILVQIELNKHSRSASSF